MLHILIVHKNETTIDALFMPFHTTKQMVTSLSTLSRKKKPKLDNHTITHCRIDSKIGTNILMSPKSTSMLEFQAHICWMITVDYKVRLGKVKSELEKTKIDSFCLGFKILPISHKIRQCVYNFTYVLTLSFGF